jgi:hypothetical protein
MIDLLDRVGIVALALLFIVGVPMLASKGNAERQAECRANGGKVVVFQNRSPGCVLP